MFVLLTAYGVQCLVAGSRRSGAGQQAVCPGRGMLHDYHEHIISAIKHSVKSS